MSLIIRSDGQTGVDRAALDAALTHKNEVNESLSVYVTGWCPKERLAEDGPIPIKYPVIETETASYDKRTRLNVIEADATLILCSSKNDHDSGTKLTIQTAQDSYRLLKVVEMIEAATLWQSKQAKTSKERKKKTRIFAIAGHAYLWQLETGRKKEEISKLLKHHPLLKFFANWAVYLIHFRSKKRPAAKHSRDI